jgi:hypothetical protein
MDLRDAGALPSIVMSPESLMSLERAGVVIPAAVTDPDPVSWIPARSSTVIR